MSWSKSVDLKEDPTNSATAPRRFVTCQNGRFASSPCTFLQSERFASARLYFSASTCATSSFGPREHDAGQVISLKATQSVRSLGQCPPPQGADPETGLLVGGHHFLTPHPGLPPTGAPPAGSGL